MYSLDYTNFTSNLIFIGLINGTAGESSEGRVEIYRNNTWGTVCDDLFNRPDANTVCRQWGARTPAISWRTRAGYGRGTGPIHFDNINCAGTRESFLYCGIVTFHDCSHAEDVGVKCPTVRKFYVT